MFLTKLVFIAVINILALTSVHCLKSNGNEEENGKLIFASVLFRHGDRTPINPYPTDPWKDHKWWPVDWGQLTNTGKQQHYELGKWLRQRYSSLVSEKYNKSEIYVRSTDVDRTIMSALANLAGFYAPKGQDVWNGNITWQPSPVHTIPVKEDQVLSAKKSCPVFDRELKKLHKSPEFKAVNKKYKPLFDYLTKHTGTSVTSVQAVQNVFSCLYIEELNGFELPGWTHEVYPEKMYPASAFAFAIKTYTTLLARLKSGPLLKEILDHFKAKLLHKLEQNYWVYSAHDTTVANMLNTLGVFKPMGYHNPPFAATILFELRKFSNGYKVQVFYKNTTAEPQLLHLPGCGTSCSLEKMFEVYRTVLPVNWQEECSLDRMEMSLDTSSATDLFIDICAKIVYGIYLLILLLGCIVLVLALFCIIAYVYFKLFY